MSGRAFNDEWSPGGTYWWKNEVWSKNEVDGGVFGRL